MSEYSFDNLNVSIKSIIKLWEQWFRKPRNDKELKKSLSNILVNLSKLLENYFSSRINWKSVIDDISYEINSGAEKDLSFLYDLNYDMTDPLNDIFNFSDLQDDLKKIPYLMRNGNFKDVKFEFDGHRELVIKVKTVEPNTNKTIEGIASGASVKNNYKLSDYHDLIKVESSYFDKKKNKKVNESEFIDIILSNVDTFCFASFNNDNIEIKICIRELWIKGQPAVNKK